MITVINELLGAIEKVFLELRHSTNDTKST